MDPSSKVTNEQFKGDDTASISELFRQYTNAIRAAIADAKELESNVETRNTLVAILNQLGAARDFLTHGIATLNPPIKSLEQAINLSIQARNAKEEYDKAQKESKESISNTTLPTFNSDLVVSTTSGGNNNLNWGDISDDEFF